MYHYLKSLGLYPVKVTGRYKRKKQYHVEFRENRKYPERKLQAVITDWGYVRGVFSIHLCLDEVVLESEYGDCKINIYYKSMGKFEVIYDEEM